MAGRPTPFWEEAARLLCDRRFILLDAVRARSPEDEEEHEDRKDDGLDAVRRDAEDGAAVAP